MNAVTCLNWVKRGAAKARPDKIKLTEEELCDLVKGMKESAIDEDSDMEKSDEHVEKRKRKVPQAKIESNNSANNFKIDDTNEENTGIDEDSDDDQGNPLSMAGIAYYASQKEDPHLSKEPDSDDDEEILDSDNLITVGKVNKEFCNLEVYVYDEEEGNCWCHHDYILPTIPLCIEWLDFDVGSTENGNFVAIGTMGPDIELWDLDVLDTLEPTFILAGSEKSGSKKKKKKKMSTKGHSDAILDLSWNRNNKQALASASADFTLGLWDLDDGKMVTSFQHNEKVQSIEWHPTDAHIILSGSADKVVRLFDCRTLEPDVKKWTLSAEVENVIWDSNNTENFIVSSDDGHLYGFDRRMSNSTFEIAAHNESVTGISLSNNITNCLVTSSSDKTVKVWDIKDSKPKHVCTKELKIGQLFCVSECPDASMIFAVGGEREMRVLNLKKHPIVAEYFGMSNVVSQDGAVDVPIGDGFDDENEDEENIDSVVKKKKKKSKSLKYVNSDQPQRPGVDSMECGLSETKVKKKKKKKKQKHL